MKLRPSLATAALLALFAAGAFAQTASTPRIDKRESNQQTKIDNGVASGQLTSKEAKGLEAQQNRVGRMEDRAKADGTVTEGERAHIKHVQNKAKRDIRRQKHDAQSAAPQQ